MNKVEILAPAGNIKKGYVAISAGCDAIYGGLEFGNARQWAKNFSISEYKEMLNYCHEKNVKFYLTLNILLRTEEVDEIILFLHKIELPDAVIVADVGLMLSIKEHFSQLPIHASTQFGASSIEDIRFLEDIGVTRAILSRELTLDEIKHIKDNTNMELEVFVYGTQCVMFSGQCLWGGLINESSGNRGKCSGMCRDFYECNGVVGQLLYPRDLELGSHIQKLQEIGVTSIKIEGRLRDEAEIKKVVEEIKLNVETEGYSSYLSNRVPVNGMFSIVNPRIKYSKEKALRYSENDLLFHNDRYEYGNALREYIECEYIKTVYNKPLIEGVNIALKLKYEHRKLKCIYYTNRYGERKRILLNSENSTYIYVDKLCSMMIGLLEPNVYQLVSEVPFLEKVYVDLNEIKRICLEINELCRDDLEIEGTNTIFVDKHNNFIQTNKVDDIIKFSNHGFEKFIFEIETKKELEKALMLTHNIVFRLPVLDFSGNIDKMAQKLENKKVMLTKLSQLELLKIYNFKNVIADYSINCWNERSLGLLKKYGVSTVTVHPELELNYSLSTIKNMNLQPSVIISGHIPLGYTRACFREIDLCDKKCNSSFRMKNINKGYEIEIDCSNDLGIRAFYRNNVDIAIRSMQGIQNRIQISRMSEQMKEDLLINQSLVFEKPNYLYRRSVR